MKTGFSQICINPPYGAPIVGYYEPRFVKGILDNLYARAIVFDDGSVQAAVIALDLCLLGQKYFDAMKKAIRESTGIREDAIFINCSHTHTGPLVGGDFASGKSSSEAYDTFLITSVRDAVLYALQDLKESRFEAAEAQAHGISFVRRYRMKDGSVATNPGVNNPAIDRPLGTPNETVKLVKILRPQAEDIFILHFGTHPDSVGGEYISADYMGCACSTIERALPNTRCMFLLGPQGDVNHVNTAPTPEETALSQIDFDGVPRGIRHAEHMGRVIAAAALSVCSVATPLNTEKICFTSAMVELPSHKEPEKLQRAKEIYAIYEAGRASELPYKEMELTTAVAEASRIVKLENGPDSFPFRLSAIRIGELVFAGIGGEPFTEIGNRICAASPFKATLLCCLTNSPGGYIPTAQAYSEGGYEAKSSSLKPGGDDMIVAAMETLFRSL